ncbi:MAG TPA: TIGR03862 family flavoprotein [Polaromonas sp.]|uniref:TIGR03862 family flavoprotein n=1 Tax=Polaromonas sp. TaxID=1869339 RepID=UPI002D61AADE|nr:TIGR03862 family flavoprotein [Polaromonas sp.]HYW58855.1 TIGR03862 family flavoprotein [Polaromonas sp.]
MSPSTSQSAPAGHSRRVAVIGGGPAGLMAAEVLAAAGVPGLQVQLYDTMPSVGRKFLLAGKGGLNLTHSEAPEPFLSRYGERSAQLQPMLAAFSPAELRAWAGELGVETFVGSSGRVFPKDMKAAPLLRAWLHRLRAAGVQFNMRHRWVGWDEQGALKFSVPTGELSIQVDAVVLALGGASWARLGSDGAWVPLLAERGVAVAPLQPSNCGFDVGSEPHAVATAEQGETRREFFRELIGQGPSQKPGWTEHFSTRFAGQPFKSVAIHFTDSKGRSFSRKGEFIATATGVEGSLIYAASSLLRDEIAAHGSATFMLDLLPDKTPEQVLVEVRHPRGSRSLSSHLKSRLSLDGIKAAMLHELLGKEEMNDPVRLARAIKALPLRVTAAGPIDEAISSAGGVMFEALDAHLQIKATEGLKHPVFCAGEMLDWEAPTGGYLLTASFASGRLAASGALAQLGFASVFQGNNSGSV